MLYITTPYNYYTPTLLDCTQTVPHITLPLLYLHINTQCWTWLDQYYHYFTSHNFTFTLPHAAQPHIYFTLILYQINVYLFSTVRYNTLPSLNFALTKPNFMEFNITLTKHSNTNLSHTLPMLLCTKLKWTTWYPFSNKTNWQIPVFCPYSWNLSFNLYIFLQHSH